MLITPAQLQQLLNDREAQHSAQDHRIDLAARRLVQAPDVARVMAKLRFPGKR